MASPSSDERLAIIDVTIAYCWALDNRDWYVLESVFVPDATAELASPLLTGLDAIVARVRSALDPLDASQHIVTNHQVEIDDTDRARATCRCQLQAQHVRRDVEGGHNLLIGGHYEDRMVRGPDGWRISHRRLVVTWSDGNPAVLRPR